MTSREQPAFMRALVERRKKQGMSLTQIAGATKIGVRYLEAIERGDFHALPGGVYSISYLRQYARAIDFDEDDLLACYQESMPAVETAAAPAVRDPWLYRFGLAVGSFLALAFGIPRTARRPPG